jgi:uncharacterized protein YdeI (YjbR/CyaY-like superfamily)
VKPTYFETAAALRVWFRHNHTALTELWIGFYKTGSGRASVTYKEALDEALGHGWIDGVRKTVDQLRWTIRFTPRRTKSRWSQVNLKRAAELRKLGRMAPAGESAYASRDRKPKKGYSYENQPKRLAPKRARAFAADRAAWAFFEAQPPSYRQKALFWVESAAQEETRDRRLRALVEASAKGERLGPVAGKKRPAS